MTTTMEEPSSRLKRLVLRHLIGVLIPLLSVSAALVVSALVVALAGQDPGEAYSALWRGALGTRADFGQTLINATPLLLVGLGVAIALQANFFNIGGEGQLYLGALGGTWLALTLSDLPTIIVVPLAMLVAAIAGAAWALIPGVLRVYRGTNEVISTILLNYIGVGIVSFFIYGPLREPGDSVFPQTDQIPPSARLPFFTDPVPVHLGFWISIAAAILASVFLFRTAVGYEIRVSGSGPEFARYSAIPVGPRVLTAVALSGAAAGLAGSIEILGVHYRLQENFIPGVAFTAVAVALLGRARPLGVVLAALFIGGLFSGADSMQRATGIPAVLVYIVQALFILFLVASTQVDVIKSFLNRFRRVPLAAREEAGSVG